MFVFLWAKSNWGRFCVFLDEVIGHWEEIQQPIS